MTQQTTEFNEDKLIFEEIKKVISENDVIEASDATTQMYGIGNHKAIVVVSRNNFGDLISTSCKIGNKIRTFHPSIFNEQDFAFEISEMCRKKSKKINIHTNQKQKTK